MLCEKLKEGSVLLYGITPPKIGTSIDKTYEISSKLKNRIPSDLIDGFIIYDLQDESLRNSDERIFEFFDTIKPEIYHEKFLNDYEAVIYKVVNKFSKDEFLNFINKNKNPVVFVGSSSSKDSVKFSLKDAYKIKNSLNPNTLMGGICIPERHNLKNDEHFRVAKKSIFGCKFFITQAVYDLESAKKFIDDYAKMSIEKRQIIFTLTPCGSSKMLNFMKWLGIYVGKEIEKTLLNSQNMLEKSISLSLDMFKFLNTYSKNKGISIGVNVESISKTKVEIEASISLLKDIRKILK
ncbi:5,10-methylenetetrahydrofolate reductase [Campylobacter sp. FMV-PI01]|uniref:5,10-methylenetetrahydrofolate reductase n=1 Tax=Campylobacter portucalensis TaxID=2608384 RepID=A0A6L5WH21_9BACT|nr:methylenetetrahydrofolate reductase [Campylobacter portucalensis]MSN96339.1 5,10-methylenetetrahydrofolate reductase [Campylobacter portucalensis]